MLPMYNTDLNFGFSVLITGAYMYLPALYLGRWKAYSVKEMFGPPENDAEAFKPQDTDSECKMSTDSWSGFVVTEWLGKVQGLFGQGLQVKKCNEAKGWSLQRLGMGLIKRVKEIVRAKISPKKHFLAMFSGDVSSTTIKSHGIGHNAFSLLVCNTAETKNEDNWLSTFPDHHTVIEIHSRQDVPRPRQGMPESGLVRKVLAITNVIIHHPDKSGQMGNHEEHRDGTIQGIATWKSVDMRDEEPEKFTYIKRARGQRVWNGSLSDGHGVVAVWRSEVDVVLISGASSRQVQISEGPPESTNCNEQGQHTAEEKVTDPDDSQGDEDDEDQDYFARMTEAYKTNFCEETADLFTRTMEAGRWDDIVRQLNFTKPRADQLFDDSVSTLKQKAGEAYDSHPHHSSPPESLFRLQEDLVREAVLTLAQQCRQQNVMSPQSFGKK